MAINYYENNTDLKDYFHTLPPMVKTRIIESGIEVSTLGELMQIAEHFKESD
ncbi:hypothetical protein [Youxingia wuxianensis]|uniref:Uncharacterized protein n=1 Tax=Youxingia wuxianensis TaxID=2763678 RepID=A0A926EQN5_9FIRM|nr:hypothetical protein [Youxingia wuxianensis]MBC8584764.1 hypothetical protein [Youxingia wuxianensis]